MKCADCGRAPEGWKVDQGLLRRQAVSRTLLAYFGERSTATKPLESGAPSGPLEAPQQIGSWMDRFWAGMHEATDSEFRDVTELQEAVHELVDLRSSIGQLTSARPFARAAELATNMASGCAAMVGAYLSALRPRTPLEAQTCASEA